MVLYSPYSDRLTIDLVKMLQEQRPSMQFDAVYCSLPGFNPTGLVCFNQIYFDFEVIHLKDKTIQTGKR